jgi:hypothetical protein
MNKQKIIQVIEDNKHKYGYLRGDYRDNWGTKFCTLGLLMRTCQLDRDLDVDVHRGTAKQVYELTEEDCDWMTQVNDFHCHSFDCMIEAIKNYKQSE